jgi:hypothetical protein
MKVVFSIAILLAAEIAGSAQTVGNIELHNDTGSRMNYGIWEAGSWRTFSVDTGFVHTFNDSGRLNFLITTSVETSVGNTEVGRVQYWLDPGNAYEFVKGANGVWDLRDLQQHLPVRTAPGLVVTDDGNYVPEAGFEWVDKNDPNNFAVRLEPHLVLTADGKDIHPGIGYVWVDKDDPTNFAVRLRDGLVELSAGVLVPAPGYDWLFPLDTSDPGNPRNFWVWIPPSSNSGSVQTASGRDVHDMQGGPGSGGGANRSPASDPATMMTADMIHSMLPDAIKAIQDHNAAIDEAVEHINNGKGGGGGKNGGGTGTGNSGGSSGGNAGGNASGNAAGNSHEHGAGDSRK